jgi:hypothetical protein
MGWVDDARYHLRMIRLVLADALAQGEDEGPPEAPTLSNTPATPIGEVRPGAVVKVVGQVRCFDEPELRAPLSGRRCAYYRTRLLEADEQNVLQETGAQSFFVGDATGEVLVLVDEPEVELAMDADVRWKLFDPLGDEAQRFLERHGRESHNRVFRRDIQFEEGLLEPGETVAVLGRARRARGGVARYGGYRQDSATLVLEAPETGRIAITDIVDE